MAAGDGFGDAAVVRGDDGESGGHGFEHGVGDAFLVGEVGEFAGVEEEVGALEFAEEAGLVHPAEDVDVGLEAEGVALGEEGVLEGPGAADGELEVGEVGDDEAEGFEGGEEAFFGDQAAGLDEAPGAVFGGSADRGGEGVEGNGGVVEAEFVGGAAEGEEAVEEGLAAGEDEGGLVEDGLEIGDVGGVAGEFDDVDAVKGDQEGAAPGAEHVEVFDGFVAVIDVDQGRVSGAEEVGKVVGEILGAAGDGAGRGPLLDDVLVPEAENEIAFGARPKAPLHDGHPGEGDALGVLQLFREDSILVALQIGHLAVEALHFRFQPGPAEADQSGQGGGRGGEGGRLRHSGYCFVRNRRQGFLGG